ncbi:MAG: carboxypeptidase regulatory-like domain-containing protein, partial [Zavarzinia sp.]|nr:carboxypeptidase regulatory-like domain-containing protein [Zavarzinia sp.]
MAACALLLALPPGAIAAEMTTAPLTARGTATGTTAQPVTTPILSARGMPATATPDDAPEPEAPPAREPAEIAFTPVSVGDRPAPDIPASAAPASIVTPVLSARGLAGGGTAAPITTGALSARGLNGALSPPAVDEPETAAQPPSPFDPDAPSITGKVLDALSGNPVAQVLVTDAGGGLRACSDEDGTYRLSVIPDRSYTLRLVRRGYEPVQINVYSGPKGTVGDALLLPAPDMLLADCQGTPAKAESPPWAGKPVTIATDANSSIVGRVLDAMTGRPLPWATIRIAPGETTVTTNERGEYVAPVRVTEVASEFKVAVEAEDYEQPGGPIAVTVGRDRAQFGDVLMLPLKPPPTPVELTERTKLQELQGLLTDRGFSLGTIDGVTGTRTRQAISDFQASQGLPADGTPTQALLDILRSMAPAPEAADTANEAPLDVRTGALVLVGHDTPLEVRTGPITLTGH